ncbi:uncharacterized protein LOC142319151 isoform X2 [Lycorma delicatula]|uniref:uncharacterized protein LOC142319151 isoform X2 n=1 Tax=Lycorma delicatula TaxID=130591 RepID=UPI003F51343C
MYRSAYRLNLVDNERTSPRMNSYIINNKTVSQGVTRKKMISRLKSEGESEEGEQEQHKTRAGRTLRNRRYRRVLEDQKQSKRLFTPEIKRFLKSWLVRRRKNPYPNRSEKKDLALKTGLTYVQICNWFANWRRKLKKSSKEKYRSTWGSLIKDYNTKAQGNVEQFSISSDDSIWDETAYTSNDNISKEKTQLSYNTNATGFDHSYFSLNNNQQTNKDKVLFGIKQTSTSNEHLGRKCVNIPHLKTWGGFEMKTSKNNNSHTMSNSHYKKGTKRLSECENNEQPIGKKHISEPPVLLSKWLESAARFVPRDSFMSWSSQNCATWHNNTRIRQKTDAILRARHREEELDAAEALTSLSRQQCVTTNY